MATINLVLVTKIGDKYKKRFVKGASEVVAEMTQAEYDALAINGQPSFPAGTDATWDWAGAWKEWEFDSASGKLDTEGYLTEAWPGFWVIRIGASCEECNPRMFIEKSAHTIVGTAPNLTVTPDPDGHDITNGVLTLA